ncbi:MAG: CvpA family protein [Candidatus Omnitrophica bacterium]|nr:CvpA family protein [Candidatus Omnitrophota bacterium]
MILLQLFGSSKIGMLLSHLGFLDIALVVVLVLGVIVGYVRGFSHQFPRFIAIIITIVVAVHYYDRIGSLVVAHSIIPKDIAQLVSFLILAIGANVVTRLILIVIQRIGNVTFVYFWERIVGGLVGALRFVLLLGLVIFFINILTIPIIDNFMKQPSHSGQKISNLCMNVHDYWMRVITGISEITFPGNTY